MGSVGERFLRERPERRGRRPGVSGQRLAVGGHSGCQHSTGPFTTQGLRSLQEEKRPPATTRGKRQVEGGLLEYSSCVPKLSFKNMGSVGWACPLVLSHHFL